MGTPYSLTEKKIVITGASSGIGRQCAILFSQFGAQVIIVGRNKERLSETFNNLKSGQHIQIQADITNYDFTEKIIKDIFSKCGKIDGFVHSAGIELSYPLNNMSPALYEKVFSVNLIAGFEWAKQLSKTKYISPNGASFVFISSIMSQVGNASIVAYSASKGALVSGAKSMAIELAPKKIRVNSISPGYLDDTPMTIARFYWDLGKAWILQMLVYFYYLMHLAG
jgi:NAD(P)-dependent dehydrogenase (short-subunit alcohol dehydrogenase family)